MALEVSKAEAAPFTPMKMASDTRRFINDSCGKSLKNPQTHVHSASNFRWTTVRRRLSFRRRKLPTVRLGAGGKKPRRGFFLVRLLKRVKLRALKQKYICMVKKLRDYYRGFVRDLVEAGGTIESFQHRMLLESSFAVPVMGLSFNSFPNNNYALDHRSASTTYPPRHHHHV